MKEVPIDEAWKKKYPEQIVFVVSTDAQGRPNVMCAGWFMPVASEPPLVGVSIAKVRHTRKLISETKEFVIAFPAEDMGEEVLFCGTHSGNEVDKFRETDLVKLPSKYVKPPLIDGCVVNFECKLLQEIPTGSHISFIGEIVAAHVQEEDKSRLYNFGNLYLKGITRDSI